MPSPFPGMDPYLEAPSIWPDVHHELMSVMRGRLNELLRPRYVVRIEERVYVSDENDPGRRVIVPDLRIAHGVRTSQPPADSTSIATVEPIVVTTMVEEEIREARLEIVDPRAGRVLTIIEVLSPANKVPGSRGRESYSRKRRDVLTSSTHLVEIDLLRGGERMMVEGGLPACEYLVHVSRVEDRPQGTVWPIRLPQPLPVVPVPLAETDPDAALDLQQILNTAYENAGYDLTLDYGDPAPPPALRDEHVEWCDELLRESKQR